MYILASREINKMECAHCPLVEKFRQVTGGDKDNIGICILFKTNFVFFSFPSHTY